MILSVIFLLPLTLISKRFLFVFLICRKQKIDFFFLQVETVLSTRNGNYGELSEAQIEDVLDAITDAVKEKNDKGTNCLN